MVDDLAPAQYALDKMNEGARITFEHIVGKLQDPPAGAGRPIFFPNGIELIFVKLQANVTPTITATVEIRVAGAAAPAVDNAIVVSSGSVAEVAERD